MVAPRSHDLHSSQSSQRRRKGTIASRYLQAIGIQCGDNLDVVNTSEKTFRSLSAGKTKTNKYKKNNNRTLQTRTIYDKISGTAKAADCSKSIITASTAVMLDHSDSISSATMSPGRPVGGKLQRSSPQSRARRRGRSPTANRFGTNSNGDRMPNDSSNHSNRSHKSDDLNHEYVYPPGSRSAPSSPNRYNLRINQESERHRGRARSWSDRTGRTLSCIPQTNPRMPANSPGPQPRSPPQYSYIHGQHNKEDNISPRSIDQFQNHIIEAVPQSTRFQRQPTDSEAGAPTEIMKNIRRLSAGAAETSSLSFHYHSQPTDSEAGAPTEIIDNKRMLHRPYHLRRPSTGDGGNQVLLKDRYNSNNSDILSRVRNRYQNQSKKQQQRRQNNEGKESMPSLMDSQCSSVSSTLPMDATQTKSGHASVLSPPHAFTQPSRLSQHVENARKQSILSPSASETTCTPASQDNENNAISSLTTEIGTSQDRQLRAKSLSSLLDAKEPTVQKSGGLLKRPVGARVAALEAQYRRGRFTARGARSQRDEDNKKQQTDDEPAAPSENESLPDPILSVSYTMDDGELGDESYHSRDKGLYDKNDEESTLPDYPMSQDDWEPGAAGDKDSSPDFIAYNDRETPNTDGVFQFKSKDERKTDKKYGKKTRNEKTDRERVRGKSPIQPLFSSERLDENNAASIHESSIRSRSLGRSTSNADSSANAFKDKGGERMKDLPRRSKSLSERPERKQYHDRKSKQYFHRNSVPGNIIIEKETSKIDVRAETSGINNSLEVVTKEPPASIKDKIRAFNLKKSPMAYQKAYQRTSTKEKTNEEKRENENMDSPDAKMKRNNLERKSLWARYFVESGNHNEDDKSSSDDEYSVQSLREQLEKRIYKSQNDVNCDEEDDDDRSVKSLREMFEPPIKKKSGETISKLKSRFEQSRNTSSLSFTKRNRKLQKSLAESNKNIGDTGYLYSEDQLREGPDSAECVEGMRESESTDAAPSTSLSYEWQPMQNDDSPHVNDKKDMQTTPMFKEKKSNLDSEEQGQKRDKLNSNNQETQLYAAKPQQSNMIEGKEPISNQQTIFEWVETRQAPLKDNSRTHQIQKKGIKESFSDSEYSDAVTLDPSFADVSNLSNPSALLSPDTDRNSDASSSLVFENLEEKAASATQKTNGSSNSKLELPGLNEARREGNGSAAQSNAKDANRSTVSDNTRSSGNRYVESSHKQIQDLPHVVTPDSGYGSGSRSQSSKTFEKKDHSSNHYEASFFQSGMHSNSQGAFSPVKQNLPRPAQKLTHKEFESPNGSYRSPLSSNQADDSPDTPYQNFDSPSQSTENSTRGVDSSNRSKGYPDALPKDFEYPYRPSSIEDTRFEKPESFNRSGEPLDANRHYFNTPHRSKQSSENFAPENETSNHSIRSSESPRSVSEPQLTQPTSKLSYEDKPSNRSTYQLHTLRPTGSNVQDASFPRSYLHKPDQWNPEDQTNYGAAVHEERREQKVVGKHNLLVGTSRTISKSSDVPPMPSPFDENYAAIMESRHKMLMMRQRALLNRRANREKLQNSQPGFFGKTNPGKSGSNRSQLNHKYRDRHPSAEATTHNVSKNTYKRHEDGNTSNLSQTVSPYTSRDAIKLLSRVQKTNNSTPTAMNNVGTDQTPVASIISRIRPTFGVSTGRDKGKSKRQAVIDRISAVRAARLRRNHAFGDTSNYKNYQASQAYRMEKVLPRKYDTIDDPISDSVPGYRYYPHNGTNIPGVRDDDQSLSTKESNPQDYAAELSID